MDTAWIQKPLQLKSIQDPHRKHGKQVSDIIRSFASGGIDNENVHRPANSTNYEL